MSERRFRSPQGTLLRAGRPFQQFSGQGRRVARESTRVAVIGERTYDLSKPKKLEVKLSQKNLPLNHGLSQRKIPVRSVISPSSYQYCALEQGLSNSERRCIDLDGYEPVATSVILPENLLSVELLLEFGSAANYLICKRFKAAFQTDFWREVCLLRRLNNCVETGRLVLVDPRKLTLYEQFCGPTVEKLANGLLTEVLVQQSKTLDEREKKGFKECILDDQCPPKKYDCGC